MSYSAEEKIRDEIRKLELSASEELKEIGADRTSKIKDAVLATANDIVARVMRENANKMNEQIGKQIEALVGDQLKCLGDMVKAAFENEFGKFIHQLKSLDERNRGNFLRALEDIDVVEKIINKDSSENNSSAGEERK